MSDQFRGKNHTLIMYVAVRNCEEVNIHTNINIFLLMLVHLAEYIIDTLEPQSRNIYTGNAGYILYNGDMSFNICIRTLLKTNNFYEYGIGGGIVWDSNAEDEWHEAQHKSKILEPLL